MRYLGFAITVYQQNILHAVCLQKKIKLDILFLSKSCTVAPGVVEIADKIVFFHDKPFSWRSIIQYRQEFKNTIVPELEDTEHYHMLTWSHLHPIARYTINTYNISTIVLFEEGSGSYLKWGIYNSLLGPKTFLASSVVFLATHLISRSFKPLPRKQMEAWALLEHAFPDLAIPKMIIDNNIFCSVMSKNDGTVDNAIDQGASIFITSSYVEFKAMSEEEYVEAMVQAVERIKSTRTDKLEKLLWKTHPRTNMENEATRISTIARATGVSIEFLLPSKNIEYFAAAHVDRLLYYYSIGSTSLYVIKALAPITAKTYLVKSPQMMKLRSTGPLYSFLASVGVQTL